MASARSPGEFAFGLALSHNSHRYCQVPHTVGWAFEGPFITHARIGHTKDITPRRDWNGMLLIYAYYFMYAFVFSVTIPTSAEYVARVTGRANLSGPLIATFNFGGVVMQPVQAFLLRRLGVRWSYTLFCAFFVVGSIMYVLAHVNNSVVLLFAGRAVSGACSGAQLFFDAAHRTIHEASRRRTAVIAFVLAYSSGYAFALVCATLVSEQITYDAGTDVNALTVPGILSATLATLVGVMGAFYLRDPPPAVAREVVPYSADSFRDALLCLAVVVVVFFGEGLRQVAIFNVSALEWRWDTTSASLFAAIAMLIHAPTMVLDHLVPPRILPLLLLGLGPTTLAFGPWGLALPGAAWLYIAASFLYGPLSRISFALLSARVLAYAATTSRSKVFVQGLAGASALGVGLGASAATLWDLSRLPFVVAACIYALSAALVWLCVTRR